MHASEDRRFDLLQDLDAFVWEADPTTFQFTYVSGGAERLLGYSLEDWLTRPSFWVDLLHPDDRDEAVAHCVAATAECRDHDFDYRVIDSRGRVLWIRDVVKVLCDGSGKASLLRGVMVDVTAQKHVVSTLQSQDRFVRAVMDQVLDIVTVVDSGGTIQYQTPSAECILGFPSDERVGRSMFDLLHPADVDRARQMFATAMANHAPTPPAEFRFRHASGEWRILEVIGRSFVDESGRLCAIVNSRDVTERKRLEEQFRHSQKMEAVGRLTATLAHDFNNVLQTVMGNAELATVSEHSAGVRFELQEIKKAGEIGLTLTRQLLSFSRRSVSEPESVDVNLALSNLSGILKRLLGEQVDLEMVLAPTTPRVRIAAGVLEQVLMNLASNARDAMPLGGRLRIRTRHKPSTSFGRVIIEVSDSGIGMTPEVRSRLFEPYFTTKEPGKGTGLGLSTVYSIVKENGGDIEVISGVGEGTTFCIYLPAEERPEVC